jgi:hypothetical protein
LKKLFQPRQNADAAANPVKKCRRNLALEFAEVLS